MTRRTNENIIRVKFSKKLREFLNENCNSDKYAYVNTPEMILKAQQGDEVAADYIARSNCGLIIKAIDYALGGSYSWPEDDHDELFQIAWGQDLLECIKKYDSSKGKFSTYVYQTVKLNTYSRIKERAVNETVSFEDLVSCIEVVSEDNDPVAECEITAIAEQVSRILNRALDMEEQKIIKLRFGFYDRTYKTAEIGEKFGFTDSYAGKRVKKCIAKTRGFIEENGYDIGFCA